VLLGNGDGTFRTGTTYATDAYTTLLVTAGDFNRDGKLDIITATDHAVGLLPGNGDGTFGAAQTFSTFGPGVNPLAVTAADLNADGKLDLAMTYVTSSSGDGFPVNVYLGSGDGTFKGTAAGHIGLSSTPTGLLAAADFNHDGKLDLVTLGRDMISVLPGNGDGTFGAEHDYSTPSASLVNPAAFAVGDFNGDGSLDLAVAGNTASPGSTSPGSYKVDVLLWHKN